MALQYLQHSCRSKAMRHRLRSQETSDPLETTGHLTVSPSQHIRRGQGRQLPRGSSYAWPSVAGSSLLLLWCWRHFRFTSWAFHMDNMLWSSRHFTWTDILVCHYRVFSLQDTAKTLFCALHTLLVEIVCSPLCVVNLKPLLRLAATISSQHIWGDNICMICIS